MVSAIERLRSDIMSVHIRVIFHAQRHAQFVCVGIRGQLYGTFYYDASLWILVFSEITILLLGIRCQESKLQIVVPITGKSLETYLSPLSLYKVALEHGGDHVYDVGKLSYVRKCMFYGNVV